MYRSGIGRHSLVRLVPLALAGPCILNTKQQQQQQLLV